MARLRLPAGLDIGYDAVGQGPPVLLLHGWATSRRVWAGTMADLADSFRLVAYDARGCGESGRPRTGYSVAQGAQDALAVADALGLERFALVGSSLGGNVAMEAALAAPARVDRLVLIDAPLHWFATGVSPQEMGAWLDRLRDDRFATVEAMVPRWFGPNAQPAPVRAVVRQILDADWAIDALIRDAAMHDRRDALPRLRTPTTLMHGALDPEVPVAVAREAAALLPNASLTLFDDCAHMPHLENRQEFSAALRSALE
jgi:pimeloyl-ACP methyl ester carboxylesterase